MVRPEAMNPNIVSGSWLRGGELNSLPQDYAPSYIAVRVGLYLHPGPYGSGAWRVVSTGS